MNEQSCKILAEDKPRDGKIISNGYRKVYLPDHHRAQSVGYVKETTLIAERVLGKPLPKSAVIHHVNFDRSDDRKTNLVICENHAYHRHLHIRMAALEKSGNPNKRSCCYCHQYDFPENMMRCGSGHAHVKCNKQYQREYCLKRMKEGTWHKRLSA